ncbi:MAG TPA: class I SAM-dependent methyltransferase, partial [Candidatus Elarobacter sp.]|nr:class I SAM-dependent methyltransferase [Candidatus Elarobacter sp.]
MRLYGELAAWWPLLSAPDEYVEEAQFIRDAIEANCTGTPRTVLELGSGGGNNAVHLAPFFELTLTDISESMLQVSRRANPDAEHVAGDMRTLRLGREFDAVVIHDAITYMTTGHDLRLALENAYRH